MATKRVSRGGGGGVVAVVVVVVVVVQTKHEHASGCPDACTLAN